MERLTKRELSKNGYVDCPTSVATSSYCNDSCMYKKCKWNEDALKKLKDYEDAEEQGLLLRLPCKVGNTVYLVDFEERTWDEATVNSIEIDTRDNRVLINSDYEVGTWSKDNYVFYSKEAAEQALARMEKE